MPPGNLDAEPPPPLVIDIKKDNTHVREQRSSKGDFDAMPKRKHKKGKCQSFRKFFTRINFSCGRTDSQ
jgi:hypothetical protein